MTANGEYMIVPIRQIGIMQEPENKGPWICPIIRCRRELGIHMGWNDDGCNLYGGNLPQPIEAEIINDLPYITREQFEDIRLALAASHRRGRIPVKGYNENRRTWATNAPKCHSHQLFAVRAQPWGTKWVAQEQTTSPSSRNTWRKAEATWTKHWTPNNTNKWSFNSFGRSQYW